MAVPEHENEALPAWCSAWPGLHITPGEMVTSFIQPGGPETLENRDAKDLPGGSLHFFLNYLLSTHGICSV